MRDERPVQQAQPSVIGSVTAVMSSTCLKAVSSGPSTGLPLARLPLTRRRHAAGPQTRSFVGALSSVFGINAVRRPRPASRRSRS
jgi:hypothetical protein